MKQIKIKKLTLRNFKCYDALELDFSEQTTQIKGITGYGKTTIKDAFLWALGFDCEFASRINDFLIKNLETYVKVDLNIDNLNYTIERINKQKWKTNQETLEDEFVGNETKFAIDGQKLATNSFKEQIVSLFGVQTHFDIKILCDMGFFNSSVGTTWTWKERRSYLFNLFPNIVDKVKDISNDARFECIKEELDKGLDEIAISKVLTSEKNNIEKSLLSNKTLITDRMQTIKDYSSIDFGAIRKEIGELEQKLETLKDNNIKELNSANARKVELINSIKQLEGEMNFYIDKIKEIEKQSKQTLDAKLDDSCPTCHRKFDEDKLLVLKTTFELDKMKSLESLQNESVVCQNIVNDDKTQLETQEKELNRILTEILPNLEQASGVDEQIKDIKQKLSSLYQTLAKEDFVKDLKEQVEQYKQQNKAILNSQKQYLERKNALKEYVEEKIAIITNEINKSFNGITFKFFKYNTAKAETEYQPTCECLLNGISYKNLSQGQKIIADFNVNNGLQKLLNVSVPQFIDNKQDNTFEMVSDNQMVELITCSETNINATFIKDKYTLDDCDIKGE